MKVVNTAAKIDINRCVGCGRCADVCPTATIAIKDRKAIIDKTYCYGCGACETVCPLKIIEMEAIEPFTVQFEYDHISRDDIRELCAKVHTYPEEIICCVGVTSGEVAGAILDGAKTPIEVTRKTGVGTGCKVFCSTMVVMMLMEAGIDPGQAPGYQWYGKVPTLWSIPEEVKAKYDSVYHFNDDLLCHELRLKLAGEIGKGSE